MGPFKVITPLSSRLGFTTFPLGLSKFIKNKLAELQAKLQDEFQQLLVSVCSCLLAVTWLVCKLKDCTVTFGLPSWAVAPSAMEETEHQFHSLVQENVAQY